MSNPTSDAARLNAVNNPVADKSNQSNLYGELRIYVKQITEASIKAPSAISQSLVGAMSDVIYDLEQLTQQRARAATVFADPRYSAQEQLRQAQAIMSKAFADCETSQKALTSAAASARKQLEGQLLPKAPTGASDVLVLDRKQDLSQLLAATQGTPDQKIKALSNQLRQAQQTGDDLTSYVLTQKMSFVYQANGLNPDTVAQAFAQILGEPLDDGDRSPLPGGLLLSLLSRGGAGTVAGMLSMAGVLLYQAQQGWTSFIKTIAAGM